MCAGAELTVRIDEKRYRGVRDVVAVRGLEFTLAAGSFVALVGPSGCGKTTLLDIIAGLDRDFRGTVARPPGRLGMVFQNPRLLPWRTLSENLALAAPAATPAELAALLAAVGLADCADAYPRQLSLGMQRRAAVARAFAVRPDLLLLDEPFVSLDAANAETMRALLRDMLARHPATVLMVTHDLEEAAALAERVLFLSERPARVVRDIAVDGGYSAAARPRITGLAGS